MDAVVFMKDGNGGLQPCPEVLTEAELIEFLRLKEIGVRNPPGLLRYYRAKGVLKPCRLGHRNVYSKTAALAFLQELTKK